MRRILPAVLAASLAAMIPSAAVAQEKPSYPWLAALYANYGKFDASGVSSSGDQGITYLQMIYSRPRWGVGLTTSYGVTSYQPATGPDKFTLNGLTDSALTGYYRFRLGSVNLRAGIDVGLPTGKAAQDNDQLARTITDDVREDLLLLNGFGAGMNVAPHLASSFKAGPVTWGLGARYLFAGEYDPSSGISGDNYNPGDNLTLVASGLASLSRRDTLLVTLRYTTFGRDTMGGRDVFRNGDLMTVEARAVRTWSPSVTSSLVALYKRQEKNERLTAQTMAAETGNSNGNAVEVFTETAWRLDGRFTLTGVAGYKTVAANAYVSDDPLFDGGRDKLYLEPGAMWRFGPRMYATGKLRYSRVSDKKDAYSPADATYSVFHLDAGVVYSF